MTATESEMGRRACAVLRKSVVWDNHACMPLRPGDVSFLPQLERLMSSGVDVVSLNIGFGPQTLDEHIRLVASFRRWVGQHSDRYALVGTTQEIEAVRRSGRLAIFFDVEGMAPLDQGDHGLIQLLYDLGVRWMLAAYNRNNRAAGGCYEDDPGLSRHGLEILREMKRVGMIACCSHTGHRSARDIIEAAENPVIFSHSNPASVHGHARNIPDDLILACASGGGVIGVNGIGPFLGENDDSPETFVRHVDHIATLAGIDHVGLALDYVFDQAELIQYLQTMRETFPDDATYRQAPKMVAPEDLPIIVENLLRLGYSDDDLAKVLGQNWLRVAKQVWK